MYTDSQRSTPPPEGRYPLMGRLLDFGKWLLTPPPPREDSADWYAGLCVDSSSFSDQLDALQLSVSRANSPTAHSEASGAFEIAPPK